MRFPQVFPWLVLITTAAMRLSAAPAPDEPGVASVEELRARLVAHVMEARFSESLWSVEVASLDTGRTLFEHHPRRLMSPASNSKLYTAALALDHFGGAYRIRTPIVARVAPDAAGVLDGDVIVCGRGDPSWRAAPRRGDFWATFEPFVAALKRSGVRRIRGDVIADATYFRQPPYGAGWVVEDFNDDYGAEISAVTLEDNFIDLKVSPSAIAGRACEFELMHPRSGLVFHNRTVTSPRGGARSLQAHRELGGHDVYVFGELPVGGAAEMLDVTVPRPAAWFAAALKEALARADIAVEGGARGVRWPEAAPTPRNPVELGEIISRPLRELVADFMKPSQNLETDLIFAHVGEALRPAGAPAWRTSEQCAVTALREFLRRNALPSEEVRFDEGSGLSRNNLTSAHATVALLTFMAKHREAESFLASLPVAGVDGTLRRRMRTTRAEANVRAKTGTLRWANSLSGYVTSAAGERLVFSVMLNRHLAAADRPARDDVDAIAVWLARLNVHTEGADAVGRTTVTAGAKP